MTFTETRVLLLSLTATKTLLHGILLENTHFFPDWNTPVYSCHDHVILSQVE